MYDFGFKFVLDDVIDIDVILFSMFELVDVIKVDVSVIKLVDIE